MVHPLLLNYWFSLYFDQNNILGASDINYSEPANESDFSYGDPQGWGNISRTCVDGRRQSPINIIPEILTANAQHCPSLKYVNYDSEPDWLTLNNTGHTVALYGGWPENLQPRIFVRHHLLNEEYLFHHFHLHWGQSNFHGTEHRIAGKSVAAEGHVVHVNKKYRTFENALNFQDGLLVAAFHYIVRNDESTSSLQPICSDLPNVEEMDSSIVINDLFTLSDLHIKCKDKYFYYSGSLTTPPCSESVKWIVCCSPILISPAEIEQLRNVKLRYGNRRNVRSIQNLNNRDVHFMYCKRS